MREWRQQQLPWCHRQPNHSTMTDSLNSLVGRTNILTHVRKIFVKIRNLYAWVGQFSLGGPQNSILFRGEADYLSVYFLWNHKGEFWWWSVLSLDGNFDKWMPKVHKKCCCRHCRIILRRGWQWWNCCTPPCRGIDHCRRLNNAFR